MDDELAVAIAATRAMRTLVRQRPADDEQRPLSMPGEQVDRARHLPAAEWTSATTNLATIAE
jgi:hypothetical protein